MSRKSKHKSQSRAKPPKTVPQHSSNSTWRAAMASYLKEFWLNHGVGGYHHSFDEDLSNEGLWKKKLIWAPQLLITAVILAVFPFFSKDFFTTESVPMGIFIFLVFEATAISMCIVGIVKIRDALKIRHQIREKTDKDRASKN